jgi:hypothetical protein
MSIDINLDELLENIEYTQGDIKKLLEEKEDINILWGVQPRDLPNLEFIISILQIVKFMKRSYTITILLADIHELLDSPNLTLDIIKHRGNAFAELIKNIVELFNVDANNIKFIFGSEFQLSSDYILDTYKISSLTTIDETYKAREIKSRTMTSMLYPILQALDEKYTNCDIFYGSITQINMCKYSERLMDDFYNKKIVYLLQDLTKKLNIAFFDPIDTIEIKMDMLSLIDNLYICKNILFPILKNNNKKLEYDLIDKTIKIDNYEDFEIYIKENDLTKNDIIKITSKNLSTYLDKLYNIIIESKFMIYFAKGWQN